MFEFEKVSVFENQSLPCRFGMQIDKTHYTVPYKCKRLICDCPYTQTYHPQDDWLVHASLSFSDNTRMERMDFPIFLCGVRLQIMTAVLQG